MPLAFISDIHGNLAAFKEVLAHIDRLGIDEIICLGDNIGYGPEPEEVLRLLRSRSIPSVMGNHELGLIDRRHLQWFNPLAKMALLQTGRLLSADTLAYIQTLPLKIILGECLFVHGCPPDEINTYLFELALNDLKERFRNMEQDICFVGHTHELKLISCAGGIVRSQPLRKGSIKLADGHKYILNIGSVGQPRDGNNNAKYVVWDRETRTLDVHFVPYDIKKTADRIIAMGLPKPFADRLW